ncbi:helix-turn-helix domain-containing protein [Sphingomonas abietis]|uniref:Short-chain fatty acyl-CoA regulator family protein n=1 Tax=Sphingomonas abietis TaxID=3012344 RepID=A0ABY7NKY7_9SPHN|nr:short-chain fatty acyl-CoA regulator family protein [Sphingomonas abietis]WBO21166.1 short-chain fatty acyl-CoA regulator family protein [Sphingomonas abietis]
MPRSLRPLYAGARVRELRGRLRISQSAMAQRLGISISYLSQIETDGRPLTAAVSLALAAAFPSDWTGVDEDEGARLLAGLAEAAAEPLLPEPPPEPEALARAIEQQPALARRFVALHAAWRRAEDQLQRLDDAYDTGTAAGGRLPWDEVRDWFHDAGNYVDLIDVAAETIGNSLQPGVEALAERLRDRHRIELRAQTGDSSPLRAYDPAHRILTLDPAQVAESRAFQLAHQLARIELADEIGQILARATMPSIEASRLLGIGLANYAAGAILMPYEAFRGEARRLRHDIDRLRRRFGVSFEQACHRLSTLQRPDARGLAFFFCRVDMAGNITKRHSATRLQFARFGGACPLWIMHEAVAIPDRILTQLAEMPEGTRYVAIAKGLVKESGSYDRLPRRYAVALGCEIGEAADFVYADHLDLDRADSATPIGISCRICPREDCDQRAFPPSGRALRVDPERREVVPYRFD